MAQLTETPRNFNRRGCFFKHDFPPTLCFLMILKVNICCCKRSTKLSEMCGKHAAMKQKQKIENRKIEEGACLLARLWHNDYSFNSAPIQGNHFNLGCYVKRFTCSLGQKTHGFPQTVLRCSSSFQPLSHTVLAPVSLSPLKTSDAYDIRSDKPLWNSHILLLFL